MVVSGIRALNPVGRESTAIVGDIDMEPRWKPERRRGFHHRPVDACCGGIHIYHAPAGSEVGECRPDKYQDERQMDYGFQFSVDSFQFIVGCQWFSSVVPGGSTKLQLKTEN